MTNNKKLQIPNNKELTNREVYFYIIKEFNRLNLNIDANILKQLLMYNNDFDYSQLIINFDNKIKDIDEFFNCVKRLIDGEPLQYIIGYTDFLNLKIRCEQNVLIPRPETMELVNKTFLLIDRYKLNCNTICDACCGTGCIALSFKNKYKNSKVYAIDMFESPINLTRKNSINLNLDINILKGNIIEPLINNDIKLDILVSNPPYVSNINDIEENVLKNEPINAILSNDGTYFYEEIFKNNNLILNKSFLIALEINYDQECKLTSLIKQYFNESEIRYSFQKDFYNKTRFLFIYKGNEYESIKF